MNDESGDDNDTNNDVVVTMINPHSGKDNTWWQNKKCTSIISRVASKVQTA